MKSRPIFIFLLLIFGLGTGAIIGEEKPCSCYITAQAKVPGTEGIGYWCYSNKGFPCGVTVPCISYPLTDCLAKLCVAPCSTGVGSPN